MQLTKVPKAEQENLIGAFWSLLRVAEENARNTNSSFDKHEVECYYKLWNRVTQDDKVPHWLIPEKLAPEVAAKKKYVLLRQAGETFMGSKHVGFFSTNDPTSDPTKLANGEVAYELIGYADTVAEAQMKLYGRVYTKCTD